MGEASYASSVPFAAALADGLQPTDSKDISCPRWKPLTATRAVGLLPLPDLAVSWQSWQRHAIVVNASSECCRA
jgi:hypothetical protein